MAGYPGQTDLQAFVGASSADDEMTNAVNASIAFVEQYCNRSFVSASATRYFPVSSRFVSVDRRVLYPRADFTSVSALVNGDGSAISSDDYYLDSSDGQSPYYKIVLRRNKSIRFYGSDSDEERIAVTATWGYEDTNPPHAIFTAILELARDIYMSRNTGAHGSVQSSGRHSGIVVKPEGVPEVIMSKLNVYRRYSV